MNRQPELPIDPPAPSADEYHRATCFEDLLLCIGEIIRLAERIGRAGDEVGGRQAVDGTVLVVIRLLADVLENTVTSWREVS